jgi:hypothetical protein
MNGHTDIYVYIYIYIYFEGDFKADNDDDDDNDGDNDDGDDGDNTYKNLTMTSICKSVMTISISLESYASFNLYTLIYIY